MHILPALSRANRPLVAAFYVHKLPVRQVLHPNIAIGANVHMDYGMQLAYPPLTLPITALNRFND